MGRTQIEVNLRLKTIQFLELKPKLEQLLKRIKFIIKIKKSVKE